MCFSEIINITFAEKIWFQLHSHLILKLSTKLFLFCWSIPQNNVSNLLHILTYTWSIHIHWYPTVSSHRASFLYLQFVMSLLQQNIIYITQHNYTDDFSIWLLWPFRQTRSQTVITGSKQWVYHCLGSIIHHYDTQLQTHRSTGSDWQAM